MILPLARLSNRFHGSDLGIKFTSSLDAITWEEGAFGISRNDQRSNNERILQRNLSFRNSELWGN